MLCPMDWHGQCTKQGEKKLVLAYTIYWFQCEKAEREKKNPNRPTATGDTVFGRHIVYMEYSFFATLLCISHKLYDDRNAFNSLTHIVQFVWVLYVLWFWICINNFFVFNFKRGKWKFQWKKKPKKQHTYTHTHFVRIQKK